MLPLLHELNRIEFSGSAEVEEMRALNVVATLIGQVVSALC